MSDSSAGLTFEQSHALFDILSHRETYIEIEDFKNPGAIHSYGPPFQDDVRSSTSPILQTLLSKFALKLPGLRDVSPDFWRVRVEDLINELAEAELSESYDKGALGIRKTLATAISALIEYPARGCLGGFSKRDMDRLKQYDVTDPGDVLHSWHDSLQAMIYGDLIDELFAKAAETDNLLEHDSLVQGMHEFIVVNLASLMHYTLVLSPEGATLMRMIDSVHKLIPYTIVRQTLKIGNVATMISAMMRVVLAKVSVGSVTNWIGLSSGADEGTNLLQQIISQVLHWDRRDLKHRAEKIEKCKDAPPKAVRDALRDWINKSTREEHQECRRMSKEQEMSIVAVILALSSGPSADDLSDAQHAKALEWLALQLSIRDRVEIVRVLCHRNPDHLTAAIHDAVAAYTPMIRQIHQAVNLSDTVWDFERFLTDMLKMSKLSQNGEKPSVEDYFDLLHRHQSSCHKFLHQVAKNGKEVTAWWQEYVHMAAAQFRSEEKPPASEAVVPEKMTVGGVRQAMEEAFAALSESDKTAVKTELDAHQKYLDDLHSASATRISSVIKREHSTPYGPGAYLARWQDLLDSTQLTPATSKGAVRSGADRGAKDEAGKDISDHTNQPREGMESVPLNRPLVKAQTAETTLRLFEVRFRQALGNG